MIHALYLHYRSDLEVFLIPPHPRRSWRLSGAGDVRPEHRPSPSVCFGAPLIGTPQLV